MKNMDIRFYSLWVIRIRFFLLCKNNYSFLSSHNQTILIEISLLKIHLPCLQTTKVISEYCWEWKKALHPISILYNETMRIGNDFALFHLLFNTNMTVIVNNERNLFNLCSASIMIKIQKSKKTKLAWSEVNQK